MIKIYHKEDFKDLPDFFWKYWLQKVKKETLTTGFPLFLIRVGICEGSEEESKMYNDLWNIKELKSDSTFYDYFKHGELCIGIQLNTIFDYADLSIEELITLTE